MSSAHDHAARTARTARTLLGLTALALAVAAPARAQLTDPVGDFLSTYTGPRNPDLDILSIGFEFDNVSTFRFVSTSAGAIGTTPGAPFVWGIHRGAGVADFARLGLPDIKFDALVALIPGSTSLFVDLTTGQQSALAADAVRYSGNTLEAFVPLALLSPRGWAPTAYTANLWPRSAPVLNDDGVISDFAPDDRNAAVAVTPEPATWALLGAGVLTIGAVARRRRAA